MPCVSARWVQRRSDQEQGWVDPAASWVDKVKQVVKLRAAATWRGCLRQRDTGSGEPFFVSAGGSQVMRLMNTFPVASYDFHNQGTSPCITTTRMVWGRHSAKFRLVGDGDWTAGVADNLDLVEYFEVMVGVRVFDQTSQVK
eukprot:COSAG02_NODE_32184_length_520_cov_1.596200_1_plen_142_part_00